MNEKEIKEILTGSHLFEVVSSIFFLLYMLCATVILLLLIVAYEVDGWLNVYIQSVAFSVILIVGYFWVRDDDKGW